jgi:hypothetical protein
MRTLAAVWGTAGLLLLAGCSTKYSCTCTKEDGDVESFDKPSSMSCTDYAAAHPEKGYTSCIQTSADLLGPESPVARMIWDTGDTDPYWLARVTERAGRSW